MVSSSLASETFAWSEVLSLLFEILDECFNLRGADRSLKGCFPVLIFLLNLHNIVPHLIVLQYLSNFFLMSFLLLFPGFFLFDPLNGWNSWLDKVTFLPERYFIRSLFFKILIHLLIGDLLGLIYLFLELVLVEFVGIVHVAIVSEFMVDFRVGLIFRYL